MIGVMPLTVRQALMSLGYAAGGPWELNTLNLFTNDIFPSVTSVTADFTVPTYDGYAAVVTPVFGTAFVGPDGNVVLTAPSIDFVATGVTVQDIIHGWFIKKTAGGLLEYAARLDNPVSLGNFIGEGFTLQPVIVYGS